MTTRTLIRARPREPRPVGMQSQEGSLDWLYSVLGIAQPTTRLPVNDATVRGIPAAWAAQNLIANAVGQMMVGAECYAGDGITEIECPNVVTMPDSALDSFVYWKSVVTTALCRGNWVGIKADYDPMTGYPRQVIGVPPDSVTAHYDEFGYVVYQIAGEDYSPDELVHVRVGITVPGEIMTIGIVEAHRRGLSGALSQQGMANDVWQNGAVPSGVVQIDVDLPTVDQANTVKAGWVGKVGGQRTVAVIGKRMNYQPVSWSADDAEFLASRQFTVAETALMFGLRPSDLDASIGGQSLTYANRLDDNLQRITDSYVPIMLPVEQAWSRLIPGKNFVRGNVEALLRSTTKERYEVHKLAQDIGLETKDETRAIEGKQPLPKQPAPPDTQVSLDTQVSQATLPLPPALQQPAQLTTGGTP